MTTIFDRLSEQWAIRTHAQNSNGLDVFVRYVAALIQSGQSDLDIMDLLFPFVRKNVSHDNLAGMVIHLAIRQAREDIDS